MDQSHEQETADLIKATHVLVVEDEELFRQAIVYEFQRKGFTVSSAENGKKAAEILSTTVIHVVISDIRMPGGCGIELLEHIRREHPTLPIMMMMTGFGEISSEEAFRKGADALFCKPFSGRILIDAVKNLILSRHKEFNMFSWAVRTQLDIKLSFNHGNQFFNSQAIKVSSKGLFFTMDKNFPQISDEVVFDMQIDDEAWWNAGRGFVKWVSFKPGAGVPRGVGIEFSSLNDHNKKKIESLIKFAEDRAPTV